jgi:hypothetical protein
MGMLDILANSQNSANETFLNSVQQATGAWGGLMDNLTYKAAGNELIALMQTKPADQEIAPTDIIGVAKKYKLNQNQMMNLMQMLDTSGALRAAQQERSLAMTEARAKKRLVDETGLPSDVTASIMKTESKPDTYQPQGMTDKGLAVGYDPRTNQYVVNDGGMQVPLDEEKHGKPLGNKLIGGEPPLDASGIELAAAEFLRTNKMPALGMRNSANRIAIIARAGRMAKEMGLDPAAVPSLRQEYSALSKSLANQQKIYNMMGSFVRNMDQQISRVKKIGDDLVNRVGTRALDLPLRELKTRFKGSGNEAILEAYTLEISNEIGKLSTGSSASIRELSVDAQERWAKIHDPNLSLSELIKVLDETQHMGAMRMEGAKDEIESTKYTMEEIWQVPFAPTPAGGDSPEDPLGIRG